MSNFISEEYAAELIEAVDAIDAKFGFGDAKQWTPTPENILTAVKQYRRQVNHRRLKNKSDNKLIKQMNKLDPATRAEVMKKLGYEENESYEPSVDRDLNKAVDRHFSDVAKKKLGYE